MERDRFFNAEQAQEYGLIDRVLESHWRSATASTRFGWPIRHSRPRGLRGVRE